MDGMCVDNTPLEHYPEHGLWVKREDLCCPGGPNFSKTRGVYAHVASRPERVIGVLDTGHSQGGWAVARACALLGKECRLFYPEYKEQRPLPVQQREAVKLGARLHPLQAGRSAVLYHAAKRKLVSIVGVRPQDTYMMPNALKLPEMVRETAAEVCRTLDNLPDLGVEGLLLGGGSVLVSASSGTIAAGVVRGFCQTGHTNVRFVVHQGYSRPVVAMRDYMMKMGGYSMGSADVMFVDEGYAYKDRARPEGGWSPPPFPCNEFYDLKLWRWWQRAGRVQFGSALMWNIG